MTKGIYRIVITGMAIIALLAVVRSFSGGNDVAAQRLGWGGLAFTYPGMWDLLGIIGSVLWVGARATTEAGAVARRWGRRMTLFAVAVVASSLGSEAYFDTHDTPAGWPIPALVAGVAVPVVYAVLTHVASHCRDALLEEEPSALSLGSRTDSSASPAPATPPAPQPATTAPQPQPAPPSPPAETATIAPSATAQLSESSTPASAPADAPRSPESATPSTEASTPRSRSVPSASSALAARLSPGSTDWSGRTTLPGDFFGTATTTDSAPSSPSTSRPTSDASEAETEPTEVVPDRTDPDGDPELPATYGRDGQAPPEVRRRWVRDKRSLNLVIAGADVDRRFGPPRNGARIVREVLSEALEGTR